MEAPQVQHVTKASSDELLRKFAAMDSDSDTEPSLAYAKRRKTHRNNKQKANAGPGEQSEEGGWDQSPGTSTRMVERKSLLPQYHQSNANHRGRRSGALIRHLGSSRSRRLGLRGPRDFRTKSIFATIEKAFLSMSAEVRLSIFRSLQTPRNGAHTGRHGAKQLGGRPRSSWRTTTTVTGF